ncbi:MAG: hypothetical protein ACI846_000136 [Pseudoalteromonas distincta]|jgi:hypothetical protein
MMLCSQTLQAVREEVLQALNIDALTRGQLDFDSSMITNPHKRPIVKDEESGERIYTDPVRGNQSQGFKKSSCPLPPNAFFLSKITRTINLMTAEKFALAYYAYSDKSEWCHTETVAHHVWECFLAKQTKKFRAKKKAALKAMVYLAMQNWQSVTLHNRDTHKPARVRELLSINENHWVRDWLPHWRAMHQVLDGIDRKILTEIFNATNQRKHSRTPESVCPF